MSEQVEFLKGPGMKRARKEPTHRQDVVTVVDVQVPFLRVFGLTAQVLGSVVALVLLVMVPLFLMLWMVAQVLG